MGESWDKILLGFGGNALTGFARGLQAPGNYVNSMGAAIEGSSIPIQSGIYRDERGKDRAQYRDENVKDMVAQFDTEQQLAEKQLGTFRGMDDVEGIMQGLGKIPQQQGGQDVFGFSASMPDLKASTAAGRTANLTRGSF